MNGLYKFQLQGVGVVITFHTPIISGWFHAVTGEHTYSLSTDHNSVTNMAIVQVMPLLTESSTVEV